METSFLVDQALGIVATASVSALVASGLALSFRLMGVINLAHGELMMLGAYSVVVGLGLGLPFPFAVLVALVMGLALGVLVEVTLVRRFYGRSELAILGTFGLGLILRQLVELGFGKQYQQISNPLPGSIAILGAEFPLYRLVLAGIALGVLAVITAILTLTPAGFRIRAVASDPEVAESLGISSSRIKLAVFALSTATASLAGALIAPTTNVEPGMGADFLFIAFVVVIVGGARVSMIALAAAVTAVVQNLTTLAVSTLVANLAILALAFLVLTSSRRAPRGVTV
ncbi:branched-chain amino acid ABC transporter permease [Promicromonospora soli]